MKNIINQQNKGTPNQAIGGNLINKKAQGIATGKNVPLGLNQLINMKRPPQKNTNTGRNSNSTRTTSRAANASYTEALNSRFATSTDFDQHQETFVGD